MKCCLPSEGNCTGCGACENACPQGAITMKYSSRGFLVPKVDETTCIKCGKCEKTCPSLNPKYEGSKTPKFYSFCADDEIRSQSSSGGVFTLLAQFILERNGYVCGALFNEDMKLVHCVTNSWEEIKKMRGSKYLQSNVGSCYREVGELLNKDVSVLFIGTPCQVAGLNGFLKRKYDNLLTVDLLCHGTPSQLFFDAYLKEISAGREASNVEFRSKRFKWSWSHILTLFKDGTEHVGGKEDPYKRAFSGGLMSRWSCYDCKYAKYPRQGDITIGDLWSSEILDPESNDKKGTSFVFLNTEKGESVFAEIKQFAKYCKNIPVADGEYDDIPNRVKSYAYRNPHRRRFLDLVKKYSFSKAVEYAMSDHYDICMPTVLLTKNMGSALTYYSLYNVLQDMGYEVKTVELAKKGDEEVKSEAFVKTRMPEYAYPAKYEGILSLRENNKKCDMFVIGSDQIYLQSMNDYHGDIFFGEWINSNKKIVAVASSFGGPGARGDKDYVAHLIYFLNRFSFISCREDNGVEYANETLALEKKAMWFLDPVFLCEKKHFDKLISGINAYGREYIGIYILKPKDRMRKLVLKVIDKFGELDLRCIDGGEKTKEILKFDRCEYITPFPVESSLELIAHSKFFVTDSFHGVCFAIIFRKDFLVIPRDFKDRFLSLLRRLGLENRIIEDNLSNLNEDSFKPINWEEVYSRLNWFKSECITILKNAITEPNIGGLRDIDIAMETIMKQQAIIEKCQKRIDELEKKFH